MLPIVASGLAVVQGNALLMKQGVRSLVRGFLLAFLIALLMGFLCRPFIELGDQLPSQEMLARGAPNVLDLIVAFVSGVGGGLRARASKPFLGLAGGGNRSCLDSADWNRWHGNGLGRMGFNGGRTSLIPDKHYCNRARHSSESTCRRHPRHARSWDAPTLEADWLHSF